MISYPSMRGCVLLMLTISALSAHAVSLSADSINLVEGQSSSVKVSHISGKLKLAISDPSVAGVIQSGDTITIKALKTGSAELIIRDRKTKVSLPVTIAAQTQAASGDIPEGRLLASNCYQCHGTNGSGGFDDLGGSDEILEEMREFANGREDPSGIMAAHSMGYTDAQMKAIANYLATQ